MAENHAQEVSPRVESGDTFVAFELFCGLFHEEARNKPCNLREKGYIVHGGLLVICNPSIQFAGEQSSLHFLYTRGAVKMTAPRNFGTGVLSSPEVAFGAFYFEAMRAAPTLQIPSKNGLRCIVRHDI